MNQPTEEHYSIEGLPLHQYHGPEYRPWIGNTQLGWLKRSGKYYRYHRDHPEVMDDKDYYDIGNVGHWLVLEPELIGRRVSVVDMARRQGKKWTEAVEDAEAQGIQVVLLRHEWEDVQRMAEAVRKVPEVKVLLGEGVTESSYFTEIKGINVKCRPDYKPDDYPCLVDLKFMAPTWAPPMGFSDALHKFGYYRAAAFYLDIVSQVEETQFLDYFWIVCEKEAPFDVVVYQADAQDLTIGRGVYSALLERLELYRHDERWPGYYEGAIYEVSMRDYHRKKEVAYYE
jgi:exodeoxyribonuclease VIII